MSLASTSHDALEPAETTGPPFGWRPILAGFTVIVAFAGSMTAWALLAPIESAVVAPGIVGVDSSVKTVQHLEGGIVEEILVREGSRVQAGDLLVRLRNTVPFSVLNEVQAQYFEAHATAARLAAERDGLPSIDLPDELDAHAADPAVRDAMAGQVSIFESRRTLLAERSNILRRTIAGFEEEIVGLEQQISAAERQQMLIGEELASAMKLLERGLIDRPRVLELQRAEAKLGGDIGEHRAEVASARQGIEESKLRLTELRAAVTTEVVAELRETQARAYELSQQLAAARDILTRTEIRSPIDGTIVDLKVHTIGGVIAEGEPLLDIVPSDDELVVRASIDPLDIDQVKAGLAATVRLSALNRRTEAVIEGEVTTVSADRLTDPATGYPYYLARIELRPDSPELASVTLQPGMSADVSIRTGARTPWEYLIAPIARNLNRSLREK